MGSVTVMQSWLSCRYKRFYFISSAVGLLETPRWDYSPLTPAGNGKGYVQAHLNVVPWESTAAAIDADIHSCKGPHNVLVTVSFSKCGDWKVAFFSFFQREDELKKTRDFCRTHRKVSGGDISQSESCIRVLICTIDSTLDLNKEGEEVF